ncbi:MAG: hypothetical protein DDT30_01279 [Dehalococcoidia bacterium]|nr:hypothetical protein [Bacillota bacterium]
MHCQRFFDHRGEIVIIQMADARPANIAGGEDVIQIAGLRFLQAVGGHQNCAREVSKLLLLVLPGSAIMSVKMLIFFQFRVSVGGQHFTMGIDIDIFACRLFQQFIQVH